MEKVKLIDICDFQGGSQPPKEQWISDKKDGYIRMLQIRDFTQGNAKIEYVKITNSIKMCQENDILIARYGASLGKILTGLSGAYNVAIMKTIPEENKIRKKYLYYYLNSPSFQKKIQNVGSRAAQAGFNKKDLSEIRIELPIFKEQDNVINNLDKVQNLIDKNQEQIKLLEEFIKSQFDEMFGDVILNDKNLQLVKLSDISKLKAGKTINTGELEEKYSEKLYPCFGGNGLRGYINRYSNEGEYPIIGRQGALAGNVNLASGKFYATEHAIVVYPIVELNTLWYYYGLKMLNLLRFQTGAAQPGIAVENINKVEIPFPKLELQNQFAEIVKKIEKQKTKYESNLKIAKELMSKLMDEYFNK